MTSDRKVEGLKKDRNSEHSSQRWGEGGSSVRRGRVQSSTEAPPTQRRIANELLAHLSRVGPQKWEMFFFFAKKLHNLI